MHEFFKYQVKPEYPDYAIQELKETRERLDRMFQQVWAVLSPSVERDIVMYHLAFAKKKLNDIIGEEN
jgi:hypothetical protein